MQNLTINKYEFYFGNQRKIEFEFDQRARKIYLFIYFFI